jgi:hypothetical protein
MAARRDACKEERGEAATSGSNGDREGRAANGGELMAHGRCALEANADADELTLFDALVGGTLKREDVLEVLGWDVQRYDAARHRMQRRLSALTAP